MVHEHRCRLCGNKRRIIVLKNSQCLVTVPQKLVKYYKITKDTVVEFEPYYVSINSNILKLKIYNGGCKDGN